MYILEYLKCYISIIIVTLHHIFDKSTIHPIYTRKAKKGEYLGAAAQEVVRVYHTHLRYFIQDYCNYLHIDIPPVLFVPYIYMYKNKVKTCYFYNKKARHAVGGVAITGAESRKSRVYISVFRDVDIINGELSPNIEKEMLYTIAHELRHCWQRKNGFGIEDDTRDVKYIMRAREIDADAFAAFYLYAAFGEPFYLNAFSNEEARKKRITQIANLCNLNDKTL